VLEKLEPAIQFLFRAAKAVLWFLAGAIVVPCYIVANLYFEKWWKWRESL
jgi:hypothetical protein